MKKLILVAFALLCTVSSFSQIKNWEAKFSVGAAGVSGSETDGSKGKFMWKLGVGCEYGISDAFSIQPALMFVDKGYKGGDQTVNTNYLELPIMAAYRIGVGSNMNLVFNAGPYMALGLFGTKVDGKDAFDKEGGNLNRFDAGFGAGIKLEVEKFVVGVDYTNGLFTKLSKNWKANNYTFGVNFGYKF